MEELNDKQRKFCDEYLKSFNATKAAEAAGYAKATANVAASRLLTHANVQAYLSEKRDKLKEKSQITLEQVVEGYRKLAFFDSRKFYQDGKVINVDELDDETMFAMSGFEASEVITDFGARIKTNKIKLSDRIRALDSLCRVLGYNAPDKWSNVNPDGSAAKPVQLMTDNQFSQLLKAINETSTSQG